MPAADLAVLRAQVRSDDQRLDVERRARVETIRARLAAASPGRWFTVAKDGLIRVLCHTSSHTHNKIATVLRSGQHQKADADLIANATTDLTWALAELDRLRAERDLLLARADQDTELAYWKLRSDARQEEVAARRTARR
jgi:hypothetical protein